MGEVEARIEAQGHDGTGGGADGHAGDDAEDGAVGVGAEVVDAAGKGEDAVEVLTLNPELEFTGAVAGVGADFKGSDDDDFDGDGGGGLGLCANGEAETGERHEE